MLDAVRQTVSEVLAVEPESVTEDSKFREELGADSIDLVEIVYALESRLGVMMSEDGLRGVTTIRDALDLLDGKQ
jgi:acyl carrier protein